MNMTIKGCCLLSTTIFAALLHVGCGGASAPQSMDSGGEEETAGAEAAPETMMHSTSTDGAGEEWQELLMRDDSLSQTLELGEIDCSSAHDLADSICSLAERVCIIAEDTADGETEERCLDGRSRCVRAQDRTSNRCP